MARDYAKKDRPSGRGAAAPRKRNAQSGKKSAAKPKRSAPSHSQQGGLSVKWILSLAAVGGFMGFIVYLNTLPTGQEVQQSSPSQAQQTQPQAPQKQPPAQTARKERDFRFYEMLPESEVVPPKVEEYTPGPAKQAYDYVVQSGSFRSKQDAERQRAQIAFQGLRAHVQHVVQDNGSQWYRVNVGPFTSRSQMSSAVDKLVGINIQPLVRKIPKKG
ncbi:SPOR domain-containing protein [Marinobacter sp. AL4B]|uniref:SPOR domain-containing protein n=1 Tax=Marinobacter sp. AL4B TaxID=2871173 RepID=UPI001CAA4FE0|nr:SPOR domain-containing protein [Marinobacter sp. AL4B]MBZ0332595.1 SPOR domain-containing protein [Marinobacter sp. AL4B]